MQDIKLTIINSILSERLKIFLLNTPPELSVIQWATIASENMERAKLSEVFWELSKVTHDVYEQKLLLAAVSDLQKDGYIGDQPQEVFDERQKDNLPPYFSFLEICHLPILFQYGEVIVDKRTGDIACVESTPLLNSYSDFTDECYYCHSLDCEITDQALMDENAHLHIHVCDADYYESSLMTSKQKNNLITIRNFLSEKT